MWHTNIIYQGSLIALFMLWLRLYYEEKKCIIELSNCAGISLVFHKYRKYTICNHLNKVNPIKQTHIGVYIICSRENKMFPDRLILVFCISCHLEEVQVDSVQFFLLLFKVLNLDLTLLRTLLWFLPVFVQVCFRGGYGSPCTQRRDDACRTTWQVI